MSMDLNNLAITVTNGALNHAVGQAMSKLWSTLANGGRDSNCKFYYSSNGGSVLQVMTQSVIGGAMSALKDEAVNAFNSLFDNGAVPNKNGEQWVANELVLQKEEANNYGAIEVNDGKDVIYALDDWGEPAPEALILAAETDTEITYTQSWVPSSANKASISTPSARVVTTPTLVWYDTTALITVNSDKNLVTTKVQGRDYSRKELVSNGDLKFSVSGTITSGKPDLYPVSEIQKFQKMMQYKGIVRVNNIILNTLGITHIVISDFSLTPKEGAKGWQSYSFNAIGLQPESETKIDRDTVTFIAQNDFSTETEDSNEWLDLLNKQLENLKSISQNLVDQGLSYSTSLIEDWLN